MEFKFRAEDGSINIQPGFDDSSLIANEVKRLNSNDNTFLSIEPISPINNSIYLQVGYDNDKTFTIEIRIEKEDVWKHYRCITSDRNEVINIFVNYFSKKNVPDLTSWDDVTNELLIKQESKNKNDYRNDQQEEIDDDEDNSFNKKLDENQRIIIKNLLENSELENIIFQYYNDLYKDTISEKIRLEYYLGDFWKANGVTIDIIYLQYMSGDAFELGQKLREVNKRVSAKFKEYKKDEYYNAIMSHVDECLDWRPKNKKFTRAEVDLFFLEKNLSITIPGPIKEMFRVKVNSKLIEKL